jgi:hypothetical protein
LQANGLKNIGKSLCRAQCVLRVSKIVRGIIGAARIGDGFVQESGG